MQSGREEKAMPVIKQITVRMPNRPGSLHAITEVLKHEGVNIRAMDVVEVGQDALARLMVDDPELAGNALSSKGVDFEQTEVIPIEVPDHPGGLHAVLSALKEAHINVLQLYSYLGRSGPHAILILAADKPEEAKAVLKKNWVHVFGEEVYGL
ncbi:MAG: ACT domain-containing protein [bacterium]